jgi:hypothetical protein
MSMPTVERFNPTSDELAIWDPLGMVKFQPIKFLANSNLVNEKFIVFCAYGNDLLIFSCILSPIAPMFVLGFLEDPGAGLIQKVEAKGCQPRPAPAPARLPGGTAAGLGKFKLSIVSLSL